MAKKPRRSGSPKPKSSDGASGSRPVKYPFVRTREKDRSIGTVDKPFHLPFTVRRK